MSDDHDYDPAAYPCVGQLIKNKECRFCGCEVFQLTEPKGPHSYGMRCLDCRHHTGWLSAIATRELHAWIEENNP